MNIYELNATDLIYFFGALVRISCIMIAVPIFGHSAIPSLVKILTALALTIVIFPTAYPHVLPAHRLDPNSLSHITMLTIKECLAGLSLGFIAKLIFDSMSMAYSLVGMQMGFNFSSLYDHTVDAQTPTVAQFANILATLLFISFDGHHMIVRAISESFSVVPLGKAEITRALAAYLMDTGSQMFIIAVKLSAPVAALIFVMNVAFGVVARAVPQVNVIVVSFSVNILAGFFILFLFMPLMGVNITSVTTEMFTRFFGALRYLNG